jgi:hypothetical protein
LRRLSAPSLLAFWTLVGPRIAIILHVIRRLPFRFARLKVNEPQNDAAVTFAGLAHSPHPVHYGGLDLDEQRPPSRCIGHPADPFGKIEEMAS